MRVSNASHHIASLDGLRGCAALIVVLSHFANLAFQSTQGIDPKEVLTDPSLANLQAAAIFSLGSGAGQIGVMLFFTLSFFLMFHLYYERPPVSAMLKRYVAARAIRILPLYYFSVSLALLVASYTAIDFIPMDPESYLAHLLFLEGTKVYWTIAPELLFYLVFAVIWMLFRHRPLALFGLMATGLVLSNALPVVWHSYAFEFFLLGYFVYLLSRSRTGLGLDRLPAILVVPLVLLVLGLSYPVPHLLVFGEGLARHGWQSYGMLAVVFLVFAAALKNRGTATLLGAPIARFLGTISFSLYLNHLLVFGVLKYYGLIQPNLISLVAAVGCAVLFSAFVHYVVEPPARNFLRARLIPDAARDAPAPAGRAATSDAASPEPLALHVQRDDGDRALPS